MKRMIWICLISLSLLACKNNDDIADAYGNFESTEVMISAMAQGEVLALNMEEGQALKKDVIVGLIDTTDLYLKEQQLIKSIAAIKSRIIMIDAQMDVHQQQKKNLMVDKDRVNKLYKDGAATRKQLDDINGGVDLLDAQIRATESQKQQILLEVQTLEVQIEQLRENITRCFIKNPLDGTVLTKYAEKGEVAAPGKPLYKIADLSTMKLKVYVSGEQLPHIKIGQEVEVQIDKNKNENSKLTGTISWISSMAEFTPKTIQTKDERVNLVYAVKVLVRNDGSIKIGMPGEVNF